MHVYMEYGQATKMIFRAINMHTRETINTSQVIKLHFIVNEPQIYVHVYGADLHVKMRLKYMHVRTMNIKHEKRLILITNSY